MSDLVRQKQLGDITFGVPADIALLHTPWGYYRFLGVSNKASSDDINKAYRRLSKRLHPDGGGDEEEFKALKRIAEILLDDGGELGLEHSLRRHYDEVSSLDSDFDGYIEHKGDRTRKLSEIMLIQLELKRKQAEAELEITRRFPEFPELKKRLKSATSYGEKEEIAAQMQDMAMGAAGLAREDKAQVREIIEESQNRFKAEQRLFVDSFKDRPSIYFAKVLDVFYVGKGDVTFGPYTGSIRLCLVSHENREHILELVLGGDCYIAGFPQVHFKAQQANVTIRDHNVEGIFHVVNGSVRVRNESSSYGGVIRARSPSTRVVQGFVQRGDLYVPERFAINNWWEKKPALDIAVRDGSISLQLTSPKVGLPYQIMGGSSLEDLLNNYFKKIPTEKNEKYNNIIR